MAKRNTQKALLLSTAVRNPERFPDFLAALKPFDGEIFDESVARKVAQILIAKRLYNPTKALNTPRLRKYKNTEDEMTDDDAKYAVTWALENLSGHGAGGFPKKSWGGRVVEWYSLMQEFGAIRLNKGFKIIFADSGNDMVRVSSDVSVKNSDALLNNFWLNGLMKLQPKSPFRSGTIENRPFVLMLSTIFLLQDRYEGDKRSPGLSRNELSFLLTWKGNDANEFTNFIINFRKKYTNQVSSDLVYETVMSNEMMLKGEPETRFKKMQIVTEIVDDWMRKSRMSGIIQLRGSGRYLDILPEMEDKARYIINNYSQYNAEQDSDKYFKYVSTIDDNVRFSEMEKEVDHIGAKMGTINRFAQTLTWEELIYELDVMNGGRKSSKNDVFKLIRDPLRFEFLSAIATRKSFPNAMIEANYSADDEGLPKSTAIGDTPDLFVNDLETGATIEVTLQTSKIQATNEIPAISKHLQKMKERDNKTDYFSIFVARRLNDQSKTMAGYVLAAENSLISTFEINEFAEKISTATKLEQLRKIPEHIFIEKK